MTTPSASPSQQQSPSQRNSNGHRRAITLPPPPGETSFSLARARRFVEDPLGLMLDSYDRFGPVFTLRLANLKVTFMLGPEATHHITVANSSNFTWGDSLLREFLPVLGEGLFLTDGEDHDRARRIMLPAFGRAHVTSSLVAMVEETEAALDDFEVGSTIDLYAWSRRHTLRLLMRALLGLDPTSERTSVTKIAACLDVVEEFHRYFLLRAARGPLTPWARLQRAMRELDKLLSEEIADRRASGHRGSDILSLLLEADAGSEQQLADNEVRDHMKTLLFSGQDSTTSTFSLMFYEIASNPDIRRRLAEEHRKAFPAARPTAEQLAAGDLDYLDMVLDETLRRYAPPFLGPRRPRQHFEFGGYTIPAGSHIAYSMWATHHLPDLYPEPFEFRPERFTAEARAARPKGAYAPFGGGQRTCAGMRFAQAQVRTVAALIQSRFTLRLPPGFRLELSQLPTVSPKHGLPMVIGEREW